MILDGGQSVAERLSYGESRLRQLARNRLLDIGAWLIIVLSITRIAMVLPLQWRENDFAHYYLSSRLLLEGKNPYVTPLEEENAQYEFVFHPDSLRGTNPPPLLWLFAPLALLEPRVAFGGWVATEAVSLGIVLWLTRRLLAERLSRRGWLFVCAAALASTPVFWHFCFSQAQLLLAAILLAAYAWWTTGKYNRACVAVVVAGLLKLFPFALLPWFIWRSPRETRIGQCALALAAILVGILATQPVLWQEFFRHGLSTIAGLVAGHTFNISLPAFILNIGRVQANAGQASLTEKSYWMVAVTAGVAVVALAYWFCWQAKHADRETEFCLLSAAMLAGNMTTWRHYLVLLIFPMAAAVTRAAAHHRTARLMWLGLVFLLLNDIDGWFARPLRASLSLTVLGHYAPLYGILLLGALFANDLWRQPQSEQSS